MSRKEMEREFKRELIARAAHELFLASSYEEVTVQDIASAAEFGKGTIYQYFSSKEEILHFLICEVMDKAFEELQNDCSQPTGPYQALNIYMNHQYQLYLTHDRLFLSYLRLKLEGGLKPEWLDESRIRRQLKLDYLSGIIAKGQEEGIFIQVDSLKLSRALRNIIRGFSLERLESSGENSGPTNNLELITSVIFTGITKSGGTGE